MSNEAEVERLRSAVERAGTVMVAVAHELGLRGLSDFADELRLEAAAARSALSPTEEDMRSLYKTEIDYLSARETTVMCMLNGLSSEDVITKLSLEGELEQIREELKKALS